MFWYAAVSILCEQQGLQVSETLEGKLLLVDHSALCQAVQEEIVPHSLVVIGAGRPQIQQQTPTAIIKFWEQNSLFPHPRTTLM